MRRKTTCQIMKSFSVTRRSRTSACRRSMCSTRKMPHNLSSARKSPTGADADAAAVAAVVAGAVGEVAAVAAAAAAAARLGDVAAGARRDCDASIDTAWALLASSHSRWRRCRRAVRRSYAFRAKERLLRYVSDDSPRLISCVRSSTPAGGGRARHSRRPIPRRTRAAGSGGEAWRRSNFILARCNADCRRLENELKDLANVCASAGVCRSGAGWP